ncbi:Rieske (2Fe-2S) protein [Actinomadura macrotermitis]|uniref:Cytochrome bc1 complex Rieske iron-sulfur subunit n=1 Tax=Actinomadura macrotermitis TaxID=2585200 RepID=A0A7K0C4Z9_9ACTN|nr:Rieske (2Fe-2S) protein [Actinomadura macrotermitis]MQY08488.1 Cytochrome b6-f complex iron-sulfur subunit [Actinomadura macrotermitis]
MNDDVTAETVETPGARGIGRRAMLCCAGAAAGAAALAGCAPGGGARKAEPAAKLRGKEIAKVADVPVGGGKIYPDTKLVVTQPVAGTFKAFSASCTHQGCLTDRVEDGRIECPCHGSRFKVADGTVAQGPAKRALLEYPVQVKGDGIVVV